MLWDLWCLGLVLGFWKELALGKLAEPKSEMGSMWLMLLLCWGHLSSCSRLNFLYSGFMSWERNFPCLVSELT